MTSAEEQRTKEDTKEAFEREANKGETGVVAEFYWLLKTNKKWWLTPIVIVLLLVAALIVLSSSAVAPFIYTLF